ncbi:MAG: metallophosphoesterase [Clostridiales bacterium]|uniref:YfcE family phosphodiesterase n=1 Tax=Clostridium sp. N3C TaxID=1776758 RepID=UPI00092DEEA3|nr:metallophosphoesterase [Clostridium sp. N3C]NLZ47963.1 metallophosphoesterase [Clostridiales bacterium]SCN22425.1 hypothetical protein N3C_0780 [Clostridium sp. N3C]
MLIAVVSDTHRDTYTINEVLKKIDKADILIHLGDNVADAVEMSSKFKGRTIYVKGNCDYAPSVPSEIVEEIEGKKFFITHGHNYGVKQSLGQLKQKAELEGAHIVLYGHTHISSIVYEEGVCYLNPGSAWQGRDGCESIAMIELKDSNINPWLVIVRKY